MKILQLEKVTAVEKERNRIAQDMHDDLGSGLTKIAILSEVVKRKLKEPEEASSQLDRISDSSRTLVDNLQDIIWMLDAKHDQLDNLAVYIREYATKYFEYSIVNIAFEYPSYIKPVRISEEKRRNLFLAVKETLNNVRKYAEAHNLAISLTINDTDFCFAISDDGKGFDITQTRTFSNGIKNMKTRMEKIGGTFIIQSVPGKGTTVKFSVLL